MKFIILFFLTFFICQPICACINGEYLRLKDGTFIFQDEEGNVPFGHKFNDSKYLIVGLKTQDSLYKATNDLGYLSDKGILLIILGRYEEAIKIYLDIEKIEPNKYSTASNIGTAYELSGQNENALKWIKRAIEIDPKSHNGSEWLHVKILEAKIKGSSFYTSKFLINTDFGKDSLPITSLSKQELHKLSDALYFQLNERISFVAPKDIIVGQLLFELGNISILLGRHADALQDYDLALDYGIDNDLIRNRMRVVGDISMRINANNTNESVFDDIDYFRTSILVLGIFLFAFLIYRYISKFWIH
jgi:tetratricopeptide (TPR) repeat protein